MWSVMYSDWDVLRTPLRAGAKGSRVVVTTRIQKVARIMNPQMNNMILLECLADDDCWHLILQHTFDDANIAISPNISLTRDEMIRACKGLPLVAKTLGGLLRTKVEEESEWEESLNTDIFSMSKSRVLQVLELSYHDLPSHLKRCFAYCAIFPNDHAFTEEDVILLWMAEGFLPENVGNKQIEDIGHEYFHDLVSRSFFEPSTKGSKWFKMHNLQSDLARHVAGDLWLVMKECSVRKDYRARHLSFSKLEESEDLFHLKNISHFRTFAQFDKHPSSSSRVLELIGYFQYIRVLLLPSLGITNFPESIGDLKLLQYLNLSYNDFEELPSSVSNLVNLQTLLLKGCVKLQKLSTNMRCLINLRHLDIDGTYLDEMPLGLGNLTNLQTLHRFVLGANAPIIKELKNLKQLRGKLTIAGLENLVSSNDAGEARLNEKSGLHELEMVWEWGTFTNGIDDNTKIDVLDQLQPHRSTKVLTLRNYKGVTFPSWLGDPSFTKMVVIRLIGCERCESLPSLGKLPSLKELVVQEMRGLKSVDDDFYGIGCSNPFPALITLKFKSMFSWESWLLSSADTKGFSNLQELSIKDSPLLQHLSLPSCLPLLQTLEIQHCKKLDASLPTLPHLQKLILEDCSSLFMVDQLSTTLRQLAISNCRKLQFVEFSRPCFSLDENISLEVVEVVNCQSLLNFLSKDGIEAHNSSPTLGLIDRGELSLFGEGLSTTKLGYLTKLTISGCPYLVSFPKDLVLPGLRNLLISVCENLENLPNQMHSFTSLQDFILTNCPKICCFPEGGLPMNLISVYFYGLNIEQPFKEWKLHSLNSLQKLSVSDVGYSSNSVHSFPDDEDHCLPSSLNGLAISGFLNLKSVSFLGIPNLTSLSIRRCPKLKYFVDDCLPSRLRDLVVVQCPLLKHQMEKDPLHRTLSCITHLHIC